MPDPTPLSPSTRDINEQSFVGAQAEETGSYDWTRTSNGTDGVKFTAATGQLGTIGAGTISMTGSRRAVVAKTADYTVTVADSGKIFTNLGAAGAVNFTLPPVATAAGCEWEFRGAVAQTLTITAPAGTLVAFNNAAATSYAFSTAGSQIGEGARVVCDGTKYYIVQQQSVAAAPGTIA